VSDPPLYLYLALIFLLILDLLIAAGRTGFLNTNLARLLGQREHNQPQVDRIRALLNAQLELRASLSLAQVISRLAIAGLALLSFVPWRGGNANLTLALWVTLLLTGLVLFWCEWSVESQVNRNPEIWAVRLSWFVTALVLLCKPLLILPLSFNRESGSGKESLSSVTEDELMTLVDAGQQEGVFEQGEKRMIFSIFRLGDTLAREIMVPRIDILALDIHTPLFEAVDVLLATGHSRVPVFQDTIDNILGLLYAKDLLRIWRAGDQNASLQSLLRPAFFVPETKKVDELLSELQARRIHMAIVVDEYGGVAGLVTLEDIVEEIVGEIQDEYDQGEEQLCQAIDGSTFLIQARISLDDFNELLGVELPTEEADTLGGYIYSQIGRVPTGGESLRAAGVELTVEQVTGRRIRKVRAHKLNLDSPPAALEKINGDRNVDG
jgi:putative hemolysin